MPNNLTYFSLLEACAQPGCPVCRLAQQAVIRYLDHLFYENVNDSGIRSQLHASLGFCREHTELLIDSGLGGALGMSIIYQDIMGIALRQISGIRAQKSESTFIDRLLKRIPAEVEADLERVRQVITPREACPACKQRDDTDRLVLSVLVSFFLEKEMLKAFTNSQGLCFPHFRQACDQVKDGAVLAELLKEETEKLENLHTELSEFIRKSDYRFLQDGFGPEGDAWLRAARLAAGGQIEKWEREWNDSNDD